MLTTLHFRARSTYQSVAAEVEAGRFSQIDRFLKSVAEKPDFPFIIFQESPGNGENVVITYRQADEMSSRLARYLLEEHGVKPGDIISSLHENCPGFVITMLAGWKIGAGLSYLNYNQRGKVLCNTFETSTARVLVFEPGLAHVAADIAAAYPPEKATLVCYHDLPAGTKPGPFPYRHEMVSVSSLESRYPDPKAAAIPKEVRKDVLPSSVASLVFTSGTTGGFGCEGPGSGIALVWVDLTWLPFFLPRSSSAVFHHCQNPTLVPVFPPGFQNPPTVSHCAPAPHNQASQRLPSSPTSNTAVPSSSTTPASSAPLTASTPSVLAFMATEQWLFTSPTVWEQPCV